MYQRTPLHTAAGEAYRYTVEHLVKKGADITIKDNKEASVRDYTTVVYVNSVIHECECNLCEHVHCNRQQNCTQQSSYACCESIVFTQVYT